MKSSGLGQRLFVGGVDLSGDVPSYTITAPRAVKDSTAVNVDAMERIYLRRDGQITYAAHWNPDGAHATLSTLPTSDQPVTLVHRPTVGAPAASIVGKQIGYDGTEAADGGLDFSVQSMANGYGLEWGEMLTPGAVLDSSAGAQAGLDYGATIGTTAFGLQAWLHVFDIGSGSATVAVQHSDDDAAVDPYVDVTGGVFTAVSATGSQRLQTARNESIKRWVRVNVSGTFTALDFAVMVTKNQHQVLYFGSAG